MIKAAFPLYQGDYHNTRGVIISSMDMHVPSTRRKGYINHYWSDLPQFVLIELPPMDYHIERGEKNIMSHFSYSFNTLEDYEAVYQRLLQIFTDHGCVWSIEKKVDVPCRDNLFHISTKDYWYDDKEDSYFYCEWKPWSFSEELQSIFKQSISHDKWYMMSDYGPSCRAGRESEKELIKLLKDNPVAIAHAMYIAGDPLFMLKQEGHMSKEEAFKLLGIKPSTLPSVSSDIFMDYSAKINPPCKGFPPHPKRIGWYPGDYDIDPIYSTAKMWSKEEYEASLLGDDNVI